MDQVLVSLHLLWTELRILGIITIDEFARVSSPEFLLHSTEI
jgi:hypothetical protein